MVVTLGQQNNVGKKPTVILYTYINRHAEPPKIKLLSSNHTKIGAWVNSKLSWICYVCFCFVSFSSFCLRSIVIRSSIFMHPDSYRELVT